MRLSLNLEPFETNGKWDAQAKKVLWDRSQLDPRFPLLRHASWAEPETAYQNGHFGSVVLNGDDLLIYQLWHRRLAGGEAEEWDRFVDGLKPSEKLAEQLKGFRFGNGQTAEGADMIRDSILEKPGESGIEPQPTEDSIP